MDHDPRALIWSETPLHTAALGDDLARVERHLAAARREAGSLDIDARDALGFTALHVAACEASSAVVERLLSAGAAVDARSEDQLTPLMLAVARGRLEVVDRLLDAGADANAAGRISSVFSMLWCATRGGSLPVLERLITAGYAPDSAQFATYFRLALELTGHRVRFAAQGASWGIAGDTDDVWVVDRPMTVPAALITPLLSAPGGNPGASHATGGLTGATRFPVWYFQMYEARPVGFELAADLHEPGRGAVSSVEVAHEVRCGRRQAAERPPGPGVTFSPLGLAISDEQPAIVLAMVRSAGWDPAALAAESDEVALRNMPKRGIYPVHLRPLRQLLAQALA